MKIVAHPIMVAVALGLLGPSALEANEALREDPAEVSLATPTRHEVQRAEQMWVEASEAFDAEHKKDHRRK